MQRLQSHQEKIRVKMTPADDFMVLTENDVPGSSLNGKQPHELNIFQLKRWLACHGALVTGNY